MGAEREVILARSVPAEGRSKAWVDGRMAPVGALGEAAAELVEIHGQHEHRALVTAGAQRNVLDAFAGTDLARRARAASRAPGARRRRGRPRAATSNSGPGRPTSCATRSREIEVAHLEDPDEEAGLRLEEDRLADAAAYREAASGAAELLDPAGGEGGRSGRWAAQCRR